MEIVEFNRRMRAEVETFKCSYRINSSAFLIWFLKNIFCLDEDDAIFSVCDGRNDKGIDGIWVDNDSEEIYVFQSKFSPDDNREQGDSEIRQFSGAKEWFSSEANATSLLSSLANAELKNLIIKLDISEKIARGFDLKLVFVTNKFFDINSSEYLKAADFIEPYDQNELFRRFTYIAEADVTNTPKYLDLPNSDSIEYENALGNKTIVLSVPVKEILKLDGIQDRSLFSRNVRFWVGRTRVNKGIKKTLCRQEEHPNFFLYHNGITIICSQYEFNSSSGRIKLENYQVINGCQSIMSFYENSLVLSENISVLTKIIELEQHSPLIKNITNFANNQNAIGIKDLRSTDRVQIGLQNKFFEQFNNNVLYKIGFHKIKGLEGSF